MSNSETIIQCSSTNCSAPNTLSARFCQRCRTPLIRRYLWALESKSDSQEHFRSGLTNTQIQGIDETESNNEFVSELSSSSLTTQLRYVSVDERIYLDTQPKEKPQTTDTLPTEIVDYLQLFSLFPHVPQVYGQVDGTNTWLLDYGTVPVDDSGNLKYSNLLPTLESVWSEVSASMQLTWLSQLASLWNPLAKKSLSATLVNPELIRVNGTIIQLLELTHNSSIEPSIEDLGKLWETWSESAQPQIKEVIKELSCGMAQGFISKIGEVIAVLDKSLELCSGFQNYSTEVFSISDSGPRRKNNQDHSYPNDAHTIEIEGEKSSLAIVCDGVGGHEGGEIASQNTVAYLRERLEDMTWDCDYDSSSQVVNQLIELTNEANDVLNERNDREQRQERQRMGTTLVMSLIRKHELFLTHVGDSRIYLITPESCHQITTDDDLASRETRLGYAVYRDALRYPSAGALIQALGMRHSTALYPNIRRLIVNQECLLLLCSDGLSDFDRVEQYWREAIVPVFKGKWNLKTAVKALIKIANERNGHDNATAALVHIKTEPQIDQKHQSISWHDVEACLRDSTAIWSDAELDEDSFWESESSESLVNVKTAAQDLSDTQIAIPPTKLAETKNKKSSYIGILVTFLSIFVLSTSILLNAYFKRNNPPENNPPELMELEELEPKE